MSEQRPSIRSLIATATRLADVIPMWSSGPPMPPMIELGGGAAVSVEAMRYFAAAGDDEAVRLLAEYDLGRQG